MSLGDHLEKMRDGSGAKVVLLVDGSGSVVASAGKRARLDPITFGSLSSPHLAATASLASLVGGVEFRAFVQQGSETSISMSNVARDWVVASIHTGVHPSRHITIHSQTRLTELEELIDSGIARPTVDRSLDPDWKDAAEAEIDRIFGDGA